MMGWAWHVIGGRFLYQYPYTYQDASINAAVGKLFSLGGCNGWVGGTPACCVVYHTARGPGLAAKVQVPDVTPEP
jgi:hypothetical protein